MKIKTSELIGAQLDWAVGVAIGLELKVPDGFNKPYWHMGGELYCSKFQPSTDWMHGGPLIEKFGIMLVNPESDGGDWEASPQDNPEWQDGETPLIAACRAIVMDKLGEEIEVPEELQP